MFPTSIRAVAHSSVCVCVCVWNQDSRQAGAGLHWHETGTQTQPSPHIWLTFLLEWFVCLYSDSHGIPGFIRKADLHNEIFFISLHFMSSSIWIIMEVLVKCKCSYVLLDEYNYYSCSSIYLFKRFHGN